LIKPEPAGELSTDFDFSQFSWGNGSAKKRRSEKKFSTPPRFFHGDHSHQPVFVTIALSLRSYLIRIHFPESLKSRGKCLMMDLAVEKEVIMIMEVI
jgi:hypothetical protein